MSEEELFPANCMNILGSSLAMSPAFKPFSSTSTIYMQIAKVHHLGCSINPHMSCLLGFNMRYSSLLTILTSVLVSFGGRRHPQAKANPNLHAILRRVNFYCDVNNPPTEIETRWGARNYSDISFKGEKCFPSFNPASTYAMLCNDCCTHERINALEKKLEFYVHKVHHTMVYIDFSTLPLNAIPL